MLIGAYLLFAIDLPSPSSRHAACWARDGDEVRRVLVRLLDRGDDGRHDRALSTPSLAAMHPLVILSGFMGMLIQATPGGKGVGPHVHGDVHRHHRLHSRADVWQDPGVSRASR